MLVHADEVVAALLANPLVTTLEVDNGTMRCASDMHAVPFSTAFNESTRLGGSQWASHWLETWCAVHVAVPHHPVGPVQVDLHADVVVLVECVDGLHDVGERGVLRKGTLLQLLCSDAPACTY